MPHMSEMFTWFTPDYFPYPSALSVLVFIDTLHPRQYFANVEQELASNMAGGHN